jgi:hypothetical protein
MGFGISSLPKTVLGSSFRFPVDPDEVPGGDGVPITQHGLSQTAKKPGSGIGLVTKIHNSTLYLSFVESSSDFTPHVTIGSGGGGGAKLLTVGFIKVPPLVANPPGALLVIGVCGTVSLLGACR